MSSPFSLTRQGSAKLHAEKWVTQLGEPWKRRGTKRGTILSRSKTDHKAGITKTVWGHEQIHRLTRDTVRRPRWMQSTDGSSSQWGEHGQQMVFQELTTYATINPRWTKGPDEKGKETNHEWLDENREWIFSSHTRGRPLQYDWKYKKDKHNPTP